MNVTIDSSVEAELTVTGEYIYIIFYEAIKFDEGIVDFGIEMEFAVNITLTTAQSGRIVIPYDDDSLGAFTAYSTIGA